MQFELWDFDTQNGGMGTMVLPRMIDCTTMWMVDVGTMVDSIQYMGLDYMVQAGAFPRMSDAPLPGKYII